jgi:hypothetical protein
MFISRADRQCRLEALSQQPCTAQLRVRRQRLAGQTVQLGQRRPVEVVPGLISGWGEVGQLLGARLHAERDGHRRIEAGDRGHIGIGQIPHCAFWYLGHGPILAPITGGCRSGNLGEEFSRPSV